MPPTFGAPAPSGPRWELEVRPGLAPFARDELAAHPGVTPLPPEAAGETDDAHAAAVPFTCDGPPPDLATLRTATSLQRVVPFDVPRPKALLGDAAHRTLAAELRAVRMRDVFHGLRVEAAGADTPVVQRLRAAWGEAVGLPDAPEDGDLRVRLRRAPPAVARGWEVLIRTTPRPASVRPWRVVDRPGGLDACVAAAAWRWVGTPADQRVVNLMCGGGTLLAERAALGPAAALVGVDLDADALEAAAANLAAAGLAVDGDLGPAPARAPVRARSTVRLRLADATATDLPDAAFDVLVADPPWGDAVGAADDLPDLYAGLLREGARLVRPGGTAVVVTHALRAFEAALAAAGDGWRADGTLRVFQGGHRPALHRLRRAGDGGTPPRRREGDLLDSAS